MNYIIKKFFIYFLVISVFIVSLFGICDSASASETVDFEFYPSSASVSDYSAYFENLLTNPQYLELDGDIYLSLFLSRYGGADYLIILNPSHSVSSNYDIWTGDYCEGHVSSASAMSSINLSLLSSADSSSSHMIYALYRQVGSSSYFDVCRGYFDTNFVFYSPTYHNYSLFAWSNAYNPSYEYVTGLHFSYDIDDFYTWIINNNKLSELPSYITQAKLKSFLDFYRSFGSSNSYFVSMIGDWFQHMNIVSQSLSNVNSLKSSIDRLYQEYINYRSGTHAYWPSASKIQQRNDIDTVTDNNNTLLITADPSDTVEISILRDILRGVIAVSNNIVQGTSDIVTKLDQLQFVVNVSNDGGTNSPIDFASLYTYDSDAFSDDLQTFENDIEDVQSVPQGYIDTINQNSLMPENMLEDKNSLTVNVPTITGFTVGGNGSTYSTQTGTYVLKSTDYPWLDTSVQKIKRFASILLILGYLVHLRYRIPELIRGE